MTAGTKYLVVFAGLYDDVPVALFDTKKEAVKFARSLTGVDDPRVALGIDALGRGPMGTQIVVVVITFVSGRPTKSVIAKRFNQSTCDSGDRLRQDGSKVGLRDRARGLGPRSPNAGWGV